MIVMKFGGTSVGDAESFARVAEIVKQATRQTASNKRPGLVVVVSAMAGVTDALIAAARAAAVGDETPYREVRSRLLVQHLSVAGQLVKNDSERNELGKIIEEYLKEFERLCHSISVLGELTSRGLDVVSSLGERMSAPLLAAVLRTQGIKGQLVDACQLIITNETHGDATPRWELTNQRCRERIIPLLESGVVPVISGFIGATESGVLTTLGRGGSDYSGAIIGAALAADEIQIWTDVNGVMTADPRVVPGARTLPEVTYEEIAELAYFGAKVLHPKTVAPALQGNIPLLVRNTFNPGHRGTRVVQQTDEHGQGAVKAITAIRNLTLIAVEGRGMIGVPGIAARAFSSVARVDGNVLMISQSSSEQNLCFVVPQSNGAPVIAALHKEFERELHHESIHQIFMQNDIVIVAAVGSSMKGTPGIAAKVFTALAEKSINVIAIAQGSSEANISLVIAEKDADEAVRAIHEAFQLHHVLA